MLAGQGQEVRGQELLRDVLLVLVLRGKPAETQTQSHKHTDRRTDTHCDKSGLCDFSSRGSAWRG